MILAGKRILLGVSGSISAYKSAEIIRLLKKQGAEVQVVMTSSAKEFTTPLTLSALSELPVLTRFNDPESGAWNNHVDLGAWADLILIAPASANTLAKLANGYCEDLLSAIFLSAKCPVMVAPAMDHDMFMNELTQRNIDALKAKGCIVIGPEHGSLASGLIGVGRLTEPVDIQNHVVCYLKYSNTLNGVHCLVTAGPTREPIDSVRYISNNSSGKMGVAVAIELIKRGASVDLVCGPGVQVDSHIKKLKVHRIQTAKEMHQACLELFSNAKLIVMAAAVADFTPANPSNIKIKKTQSSTNGMQLELAPTVDILAELGVSRKEEQTLVGFALETNNELENAIDKLKRKNLDVIVLNSLQNEGAGFEYDTNQVTLIGKDEIPHVYPLKNKKEVAIDLIDFIIEKMS